jgi:hypothetical protein
VAHDYAIKTALELATGTTTQHALLQKALARQQTQESRATGRE